MNMTTNQNMTRRTEQPIAKTTWRQGKHDTNRTKLQNKRHENKDMEPNQKQTFEIAEIIWRRDTVM